MSGFSQIGPFHAKGIVLSILCLVFLLVVLNTKSICRREEFLKHSNDLNSLSRSSKHSQVYASPEQYNGNSHQHDLTGQYEDQDDDLMMKIRENAVLLVHQDKSLAVNIWMNHRVLEYDDPLLIEYVRRTYLIPPDTSKPYQLSFPKSNPSDGQIQSLWNILQHMEGGFFIDCGANDGEFLSNTLWLEKEKRWTGILIEADPTTFSNLKTKHRRAWHANICLSPQKIPKRVSFYRNPNEDGLNGLSERLDVDVTMEIKVQCIPLYTILLALKRNVVDFFSLDIEGFELEVLKTIPFDKVLIKTLAVEHWSIPDGEVGLYEFMIQKNYTLYETIETNFSRDSIFVHNSLFPNESRRPKTENFNLIN